MKKFLKKLLCISLAMLMVMFCFIGCGEETVIDDDETEEQSDQDKPEATGDAVAVGFGIKDPEALLNLMGYQGEVDIKDLKLDMTASEAGEVVLALGGKFFGKNENVKLFTDGLSLAISSTLLDKSYGINNVADFAENIFKLTGVEEDSDAALNTFNIEAVFGFAEKYYTMLGTELKTNGGLTASSDGTYTTLKGTLSTDAIATIGINILEELCNDDDFYSVFNIDKDDFLKGKPSKAELLADAKKSLAEMFDGTVTVNSVKLDSKNIIHAVDIKVVCGEKTGNYTVAFAFDADALSLSAVVSQKGSKNHINIKADKNGLEIDMEIDVKNDYEYDHSSSYIRLMATVKKDKISVDLKSKSYYDYTWGDSTEETTSDVECKLEVANGKATLHFASQEDFSDVTSNSKYDRSKRNVVDAELTYGKTGGELKFKNTESFSSNSDPDRNYSNVTEFNAKLTVSENSISAEIKVDGQTIAVNISDTDTAVMGTLSINGTEQAKLAVDKKTSDGKTTYTLKSFKAGGTNVDFSQIGIYFYIDTAAPIDAKPEFTAIDDMDLTQLEGIVNGIFEKNEDFFDKLGGLFSSSDAQPMPDVSYPSVESPTVRPET